MIEKERIEHIKRTVDLRNYITQETGSTFKKNGKGYVCRCPFPDHEDNTPSFIVTPEENLFHCFGCNRGGDIFQFDKTYFNLDFTQSVKKHENKPTPNKAASKKKEPARQKALTVKDKKLLSRVVSYYQHTFTEDTRGMDYLKTVRGINDTQSLKDFGTGYVNGTLKDILPMDNDIIKSLKSIGILNSKGHESFYNCVVFPLYDDKGDVVSLYGRSINDKSKIDHLYLPGKRLGLVNRQAAIRSQSIILTESVIDALTLYDQGFKNVMPLYGVNGLTDDHLFFFNRKIKETYLVFDADDAGRNAAESISLQLKEKEINPYIVDLPDKDVNIYFKRHTPEEFEQLLKKANPKSLEQSDKVNTREQSLYKETDHGFIVGFGDRQYEIKGIQRGETQLKAAIKASKDVEKSDIPFELTSIDLYSSRSRVCFAKLCANMFKESEELIREDVAKLLSLVEDHKPNRKQTEEPKASQEDIKQAMKFLKNPDMFKELLEDTETIGVVGEETNKIVSYLVAVSRKLDKPLSILILSRSGAGKSTVQNAVLSLIPDEEYEKYTRVTDQALFYKEEDALVHKILAIEEEAGVKGAAYSIRNIQSSGKITVATTGKDPGTGKMKTDDYTVKGPVAVMLTTTDPELDQETASRFIQVSIDESKEMTRAIQDKQKQARTLTGLVNKKKSDRIIRKHHTAQRLLRSIPVVNGFAEYLTYPCHSLVTRRDHEKYLGLIEAIAFVHQHQREIKTMEMDGETIEYIEVALEDIDKANRLANEVLGQSLDELSKPSRSLLLLTYRMIKEISETQRAPVEDVRFNRRMLREYIGWTDWQIRTHIRQLEELEYLYIHTGSKGKEYSYALNYKGQAEDNTRFYLNLTSIEDIKKQVEKGEK